MAVSPACGRVLRRLERPGRPVLEDPLCGRRAGHPGQHLSEAVMRRRRYARRTPSGSPGIAAAILEARRAAGMSQRRLAAALGVTPAAVRQYEHADRTPSAETWIQLELALGPLGVIRAHPDRQQTATEETLMRQDDPAELAYPDADDAGWDPLALREMDEAARLGDLAQRMLRVSARLTAAVLNRDRDAIRRITASLTPEPLSEDVVTLLVVQAGLIAGAGCHVTADELLAWVDFDEHGLPLAAPRPVAPVIPIGREARDAAA